MHLPTTYQYTTSPNTISSEMAYKNSVYTHVYVNIIVSGKTEPKLKGETTMNFMKDIRTTITTTQQINRIIDKYEAEQEEEDDTEDLYGDAPTGEEWNNWFNGI